MMTPAGEYALRVSSRLEDRLDPDRAVVYPSQRCALRRPAFCALDVGVHHRESLKLK